MTSQANTIPRSPNHLHQRMNAYQLLEAVKALLAVRRLMHLESCTAAHLPFPDAEALTEWAMDHEEAMGMEIQQMLMELESRRGLGGDDVLIRNSAILAAWDDVPSGQWDVVITRRNVGGMRDKH